MLMTDCGYRGVGCLEIVGDILFSIVSMFVIKDIIRHLNLHF